MIFGGIFGIIKMITAFGVSILAQKKEKQNVIDNAQLTTEWDWKKYLIVILTQLENME